MSDFDPTSYDSWIKIADKLGVMLMGLIIAATGYAEIWVWGKTHRRAMQEKDERIAYEIKRADQWQVIALGYMQRASSAVELAARISEKDGA